MIKNEQALIQEQVDNIITDLQEQMNGKLINFNDQLCRNKLIAVMSNRGYPIQYINTYLSGVGRSTPGQGISNNINYQVDPTTTDLFHKHLNAQQIFPTPDGLPPQLVTPKTFTPAHNNGISNQTEQINIDAVENQDTVESDPQIDKVFIYLSN